MLMPETLCFNAPPGSVLTIHKQRITAIMEYITLEDQASGDPVVPPAYYA
jgi:hypothetical protein